MTGLDLGELTNGDGEVVEIDLEALLDELTFGDTEVPTDAEAAAIVSAIGTHLTDRDRAAARAEADSGETVNQWTLAGRLDRIGAPSRRRPRPVERGNEWRVATRCR